MQFAQVLVGVDDTLEPISADARIGSVTVGGDWTASSIAAGINDGGNGFGDSNDAVMSGGIVRDDPNRVSRIGSVVIKGQAIGTLDSVSTTDTFGIVAQRIGSLTVGAAVFPLQPGVLDVLPIGFTDDFFLREVS